MVASPVGMKPMSHMYVTVVPKVVDVTVAAGLALSGDGGLPQSTTIHVVYGREHTLLSIRVKVYGRVLLEYMGNSADTFLL